MIYYYIPDFYWHFHVNVKLLELIRDVPEMCYDDFKIGAVFGNFPNCIWNGGRVFMGKYVDEFEQKFTSDLFNSLGVPIRLTMTNHLVTDKDCYDRYANFIMDNFYNNMNQVLVSSPILEKYIREKYPKYKIVKSIIASKDGCFYSDNDDYFMSVISTVKNNDIEFLQSIQNKDKIEILVNELCRPECTKHHHYDNLAKQQLLESSADDVGCANLYLYPRQKFYNHPLCITREKIKEVYEPMGFHHFKLQGRGEIPTIIFDYAHYMVKPEWKEDFLYIMINALIQDKVEKMR